MLLDVGDPDRNLILNGCFYGIVLVTLLSLMPWRLRDRRNRWSLYLPIAGLLLYIIYETAMPSNWDIRVDLLLLAPMGVVIILAWAVRLIVRLRSARR